MSTTILEQNEAPPDNYPVLRPTVPDYVWQRIESYIALRFTERTVTWIVEGCGEFTALETHSPKDWAQAGPSSTGAADGESR